MALNGTRPGAQLDVSTTYRVPFTELAPVGEHPELASASHAAWLAKHIRLLACAYAVLGILDGHA